MMITIIITLLYYIKLRPEPARQRCQSQRGQKTGVANLNLGASAGFASVVYIYIYIYIYMCVFVTYICIYILGGQTKHIAMQRTKNVQRCLPELWLKVSATFMRLLNHNAIQHAMYYSEPPVAKGTMDNTLGKTHVESKAHPTHHPSQMQEHHAMWAWVNGNALGVILNQWQCELSQCQLRASANVKTNLEAMCQTYRKSRQIWKPCANYIANHYESGSQLHKCFKLPANIYKIKEHIEKHMEIYHKHPTHKQIHAARKSDPYRAEIQSMPRGKS